MVIQLLPLIIPCYYWQQIVACQSSICLKPLQLLSYGRSYRYRYRLYIFSVLCLLPFVNDVLLCPKSIDIVLVSMASSIKLIPKHK